MFTSSKRLVWRAGALLPGLSAESGPRQRRAAGHRLLHPPAAQEHPGGPHLLHPHSFSPARSILFLLFEAPQFLSVLIICRASFGTCLHAE